MSSILPQLIDGEWRQSQSHEAIDVTDPATQAVIARAPKATPRKSKPPWPARVRPSSPGAKCRHRSARG